VTGPGARRCSDWQRQRGTRILGTAPRRQAFVLVECARPWPAQVHEASDFPQAVRQAVEASGLKVGLLGILPRGHGPRRVRIYRWLAPGQALVQELEGEDADLGRQVGESLAGEPRGRPSPPLLLICTHGSRDPCCGQRGYRVAARAREQARDREILECSHLGGHAYAPTLLALPEWRCFGQVEPDEVINLLDHLDQGSVLPHRHRGACWLEGPAQVAEGWPWEACPGRVRKVTVRSLGEVRDGRQAVQIEVDWREGGSTGLEVIVETLLYQGYGSCRDIPGGRLSEMREYRVVSPKGDFCGGQPGPGPGR
jgi:hypothetical protein